MSRWVCIETKPQYDIRVTATQSPSNWMFDTEVNLCGTYIWMTTCPRLEVCVHDKMKEKKDLVPWRGPCAMVPIEVVIHHLQVFPPHLSFIPNTMKSFKKQIRWIRSRITGRDLSSAPAKASDDPTVQSSVSSNNSNTLLTQAQDTDALALETVHRFRCARWAGHLSRTTL